MIYIIGPLFSGKKSYIKQALKLDEKTFEKNVIFDVQNRITPETDLMVLADELAKKEIVIQTEIGGGVIPMEKAQRHYREQAGELSCLLAKRAETVLRIHCGLPQLLKGEWPCSSI